MAKIVNMHEAKTQLSRLVDLALKGEQIVIGRAGRPAVRLVPVSLSGRRQPGGARGKIAVKPSFDDPLPDDLLDEWYKPL